MMLLAQLQLIAQLTFANGTQVVVAASTPRAVVAVTVRKTGFPAVSQVLSRLEALGWAWAADNMGRNDTDLRHDADEAAGHQAHRDVR